MSNALKIQDVMKLCDVSQAAVLSWIRNGYLPATQINPGKYRSAYLIYEDDLKAFMSTEHYIGHPRDITNSRAFTRTPVLENCYPINLLISVLNIPLESEQVQPDIWDYDIRAFKNLIVQLNDQEQRVLMMRFQLGMTLDEVAAALDKSRERIRQIQVKAERKLRHWAAHPGYTVVTRDRYNELMEKYKALQAEYDNLQNKYKLALENTVAGKEEVKLDTGKLKIEELDFTVRAYNCLKRAGFNTLFDIIQFDHNQQYVQKDNQMNKTWMTIRNLGRKSLIEVAAKIFNYCKYRIRFYSVAEGRFTGNIPINPSEYHVIGGVNYFTHPGEGE